MNLLRRYFVSAIGSLCLLPSRIFSSIFTEYAVAVVPEIAVAQKLGKFPFYIDEWTNLEIEEGLNYDNRIHMNESISNYIDRFLEKNSIYRKYLTHLPLEEDVIPNVEMKPGYDSYCIHENRIDIFREGQLMFMPKNKVVLRTKVGLSYFKYGRKKVIIRLVDIICNSFLEKEKSMIKYFFQETNTREIKTGYRWFEKVTVLIDDEYENLGFLAFYRDSIGITEAI